MQFFQLAQNQGWFHEHMTCTITEEPCSWFNTLLSPFWNSYSIWTRGPYFHFVTGPCKLFSWYCPDIFYCICGCNTVCVSKRTVINLDIVNKLLGGFPALYWENCPLKIFGHIGHKSYYHFEILTKADCSCPLTFPRDDCFSSLWDYMW